MMNPSQTRPLSSKRPRDKEGSPYSSEVLTHRAVHGLAEALPQFSAQTVFTTRQKVFFLTLIATTVAAAFYQTMTTLLVINIAVTVLLFAAFSFRALLLLRGVTGHAQKSVSPTTLANMGEATLPTYTLLIPMYRESEVLPQLVQAIRAIDYPSERLDVKLILEENDHATLKVAAHMELEDYFEVVMVPPSMPKTKPKALNYALQFARGEYVAVYDAEDRPDPLQLKKAVALFRSSDSDVACLQAQLNFYNPRENWLARLFTLEYSLLFDFLLPGMEKMGLPLPLGGTSNHFKAQVLREAHAWDPFNVTEDADLGIRLGQLGYRTRVLDSTTLEEANISIGNWIRQRSRWCKGYMQTWLVHMRHPTHTLRHSGVAGFFSLQLFVGGTVFTALALPIVSGMFLTWAMTGTQQLDPLFPKPILYLGIANLLLGNGFFIGAFSVGGFKRRLYDLAPWALSAPLYWALISVASYRGLWQLFTRPFYWEKTQHGLSHSRARNS